MSNLGRKYSIFAMSKDLKSIYPLGTDNVYLTVP